MPPLTVEESGLQQMNLPEVRLQLGSVHLRPGCSDAETQRVEVGVGGGRHHQAITRGQSTAARMPW